MLVILLLNLVITLTPKNIVPTVKSLGESKYLLKNPLHSSVSIELNCGSDYKFVSVTVGPTKDETVEIVNPDGGSTSCWMDSYKIGKVRR